MSTEAASPSPDPAADPTLEVAERQFAMLGELAQIALAVSRASGAAAIASADAARMILAEEYFVPEVGRVRACGAKEAAEAFQKASRSLRLTLVLEAATAELVRDLLRGDRPPAPAEQDCRRDAGGPEPGGPLGPAASRRVLLG